VRTAILVAILSGTAHAQPGATPPAAAPAAAAGNVMDDRWAVDLSLWFGSATARVSGADSVGLAGLELSGRWRIREPIELALSLQAGGGDNNTVSAGGLWVDARWRFAAQERWNWIALAGLGAMSITAKEGASDTEKLGRGALRVGGGVERRFAHWALEADFRIAAITKNDQVTTIDLPTQRTYQLSRYGVMSAYFTVGGTYYF
jgi:hypothetical protein